MGLSQDSNDISRRFQKIFNRLNFKFNNDRAAIQ